MRPLCIGKQAVDVVEGITYDRRAVLDCLPHSFERGQLFTQVMSPYRYVYMKKGVS